jgi:hypothetical protein
MLWLIVVVMVATVAGTATATEEEDLKWGWQPEVNLSVVVPWGNQTALHFGTGWALTLHMTASENRMIGIGKEVYPPFFPGLDILGNGDDGWLVFEDPDGCPSFYGIGWQEAVYLDAVCGGGSLEFPDCHPEPLSPYPCPPEADLDDLEAWPFDETWLQFRPGVGVPDPSPTNEEARPNVWEYDGGVWRITEVGPLLGSEDDLIRYGRSDLLPGLVVLADHGPALLTTILNPLYSQPPYTLPWAGSGPTLSTFFDSPAPLQAWNLGGHFNSLGYTLLANENAWPGWGRTTLTTQLVAQKELFSPVALVDRDISEPFIDDYGVECQSGHSAYRLDGGPLTCVQWPINTMDEIFNDTLVTLRIFVVSGEAPDTITDMDGDGVLDKDDVEAMGFDLITKQKTVRFHLYHQLYCGYEYDFDGDGQASPCVYGARAGGVTGVPR